MSLSTCIPPLSPPGAPGVKIEGEVTVDFPAIMARMRQQRADIVRLLPEGYARMGNPCGSTFALPAALLSLSLSLSLSRSLALYLFHTLACISLQGTNIDSVARYPSPCILPHTDDVTHCRAPTLIRSLGTSATSARRSFWERPNLQAPTV
jgi:hypothetical protein